MQMEPITGVTHQLRIQAAYALHTPILGDTTHGAFTASGGVSNWVRQQLMAAHPDVLTGKKKATNRDKLSVTLMLHAHRVPHVASSYLAYMSVFAHGVKVFSLLAV